MKKCIPMVHFFFFASVIFPSFGFSYIANIRDTDGFQDQMAKGIDIDNVPDNVVAHHVKGWGGLISLSYRETFFCRR